MEPDYEKKYRKYKSKYLMLKKMLGGSICSTKNNTEIKNVGGLLFTKINNKYYILLLQAHNGKWMTPAGGVSKFDLKSKNPCWATLKREFREETNFELPPLSNINKYNWKNTRLYIGEFETKDLGKFKPTNETKAMQLVDFSDLVMSNFFKYDIKSYVRSSLRDIINNTNLLSKYINVI